MTSGGWPAALTGLLWAGAALMLQGCFDGGGAPSLVAGRAPLIGGQADTTARGVVAVIGSRESCSGTLIAANLVLTARHCVAAFTGGNGTVACGTTNFAAADAPSTFTVTWADDFRGGNPGTARSGVSQVRTESAAGVCGNDVALLILTGNVPNGTAISIAPRFDGDPQPNEMFAAVGYGITDPADTVGTTYGLRRRVAGTVVCVGTACTTAGIAGSEWQARVPFCAGDSGSPALDSAGRVMGVASRSNANCTGGLYATVSAWRSLIVSVAVDAARIGGYAPPAWTGTSGDAGVGDGGSASADAGMSNDAGMPDLGLGPPDVGAAIDTGTGAPDANLPDGPVVTPDAGTPGPDGGPPGVSDGGGCACSSVGSGSSAGIGALVFLALGVLGCGRRRSAGPALRRGLLRG